MFVNSDLSGLLRPINDNSVKYLVIGGYAVTQYVGAVRPSMPRL